MARIVPFQPAARPNPPQPGQSKHLAKPPGEVVVFPGIDARKVVSAWTFWGRKRD